MRLVVEVTLAPESRFRRRLVLRAGAPVFGVMEAPGVLSLRSVDDGGARGQLALPAAAELVALDAGGARAVVAGNGELLVVGTGGTRAVALEDDWGEPRGLAVGAGGTVWLSVERPAAEPARGAFAAWHDLYVFDDGLNLVGAAPLAGLEHGAHELVPHPSDEAVVAEIACGRDGSFLTAVGRGAEVAPLGPAWRRPPLRVLGFSAAGELVTVGDGGLERSAWPAGDCTRQVALPPGRAAEFLGGVVGAAAVAVVEDEAGGPRALFVDDGTEPAERPLPDALAYARLPVCAPVAPGRLLACVVRPEATVVQLWVD